MSSQLPSPVSVICADDNPQIADAVRSLLSRTSEFRYGGWLPNAEALLDAAHKECPCLVLLDIDMPGRDPMLALAEMVQLCPSARTIIFSGHIRRDHIDRALDAGAWGYVSKNDSEDELMRCMRAVAAGDFAMSPEARRVHDSV